MLDGDIEEKSHVCVGDPVEDHTACLPASYQTGKSQLPELVAGGRLGRSDDTSEVAAHMAETLANGPSGRLPDIGGPEVLTAMEIHKPWVQVRGNRALGGGPAGAGRLLIQGVDAVGTVLGGIGSVLGGERQESGPGTESPPPETATEAR